LPVLFAFALAQFAFAGSGYAPSSQQHLKILTYNIKMLPRIIRRTHHYPIIRARIIPHYILNENPDIVVFEEAFDHKADMILRKQLQHTYPYIIGPANRKPGSIKICSGLMMFSKYPMKKLATIKYSQCDDFDCMARKGVLLVEINDGHRTFQLAGTHMNGGGTLDLKKSQYREMGAVVKEYARPGIPEFLAGDYNTNYFEKPFYNAMIEALDAEDGPLQGTAHFTDDHLNNDMEPYDPHDQKIIDFILYRPNGVRPQNMQRYIRQYCQRWSKTNEDLSDHYAVLMDVQW
jgi:endonuclease/exonuclease/phosphatase family metal-dependent hydrolase